MADDALAQDERGRWTEGERLFASYLDEHGVSYRYEALEAAKKRPPDFTVDHPSCDPILFEVKDICTPLPTSSFFAYDPCAPIRTHIEAGTKKFREYRGRVCVLVLYGGNGFVNLSRPESILGAMYGDMGWSIPFSPELGHFDSSKMEREFIKGRGKMVGKTTIRNTRIAALLTLHNYDLATLRNNRYIRLDDGRERSERVSDLLEERVFHPDEHHTGITVWENALAANRLPRDLFKDEMDDWWSVDGGYQSHSFVGSKLRELDF
ncbi:MAG: hypothetical protein ACR2JE_12260 [Acidobacteriaceae bacterium]